MEVICLTLDHTPDQYLSFYFSLLHAQFDDQHGHTHQLGDTFYILLNDMKCIIQQIENVEIRINVIHDK